MIVRTFFHIATTLLMWINITSAFSLTMSNSKEIYGIPKSGWASTDWNWGYARGTGHDCAAICRQKFRTRKSRASFVQELYNAPAVKPKDREPKIFEEVKLTLGLAWQNGRWSGADGGKGGYGEVLALMAKADRYENGTEEECSLRLVEDMQDRFNLLNPSVDDLDTMKQLMDDLYPDYDAARRRCSALVLNAMGFIEDGL